MGVSLPFANAVPRAGTRALPEALALRYRVYCEEFGYLPAEDYPTGLESDEDDASAAHFHLFEPRFTVATGTEAGGWDLMSHSALAGYVRLVRPDSNGLLPVQRRCRLTLGAPRLPRPETVAEVSRLIIAPEFRRQRCNRPGYCKGTLTGSGREEGLPTSTDLLLRLFKQMVIHSQANGIRYWFAAMERPLARSLAQMGFPFEEAGPEGEYFGRITPFMADLHALQQRVALRQPRLAQWLLTPHFGSELLPTARGHASSLAPLRQSLATEPLGARV